MKLSSNIMPCCVGGETARILPAIITVSRCAPDADSNAVSSSMNSSTIKVTFDVHGGSADFFCRASIHFTAIAGRAARARTGLDGRPNAVPSCGSHAAILANWLLPGGTSYAAAPEARAIRSGSRIKSSSQAVRPGEVYPARRSRRARSQMAGSPSPLRLQGSLAHFQRAAPAQKFTGSSNQLQTMNSRLRITIHIFNSQAQTLSDHTLFSDRPLSKVCSRLERRTSSVREVYLYRNQRAKRNKNLQKRERTKSCKPEKLDRRIANDTDQLLQI